MLIDYKWMQAAVTVFALSSVQVFAAETGEEDNYYLSQMKALSQNSAPQAAPAATEENSDILAGTDLKTLAKQDGMAAEDEIKPEFKPAIGDLKPKL